LALWHILSESGVIGTDTRSIALYASIPPAVLRSAAMSSDPRFVSSKQDHLFYARDGMQTSCLFTWSHGWQFPRNFVFVDGLLLEVQKIHVRHDDCSTTYLGGCVCIPSSIQKLCSGSFRASESLSAVAFECGSRLSRIGPLAFYNCSSLSSICIPSSVQKLCRHCFADSRSLSSVGFEPGSQLSCIEGAAFSGCFALWSFCIPPGLQVLGPTVFAAANLLQVSISDGNRHFKVRDGFLMNFAGTSINWYFGKSHEITIPKSIERLEASCFGGRQCHPSVVFESGSRLICIEAEAFSMWRRLASICIPSSVEKLCRGCFADCSSLSTVSFESGSKLGCIEEEAFVRCSLLSSFCIPPGLHALGLKALAYTNLAEVSVAEGNRYFTSSGNYLFAFDLLSIKLYFGHEKSVFVAKSIERLEGGCFYGRESFSSVVFESGCRVWCIEGWAFT
jgi:hypothetical protein